MSVRVRSLCSLAALVAGCALLSDARAVETAMPPAAGAMKVGGMLVRLEEFHEMRDGRIQAQMSFHNLDAKAPASVALNTKPADAIANAIMEASDPKSVMRLSNASGTQYRLTEISEVGDVQQDHDWIAVAPGGSTFLTATFDPNGAARGAQPFALAVPVRMAWRAGDSQDERLSSFEINFRGLHRSTSDMASDEPPPPTAAPRAPVSLLPAALPAPSPALAPTPAKFDDDLAPQIAKMAPARSDTHRYLFAVGVEQYDDAPAVPFAERSAHAMTDLLRKRYGVPDENVTLIAGNDATGMKILGRLNSLLQRLTPGDTVYFYYTGHGLSARDGNSVYMVPKDAVPGAYEVEMLSLAALLHRFEESPAARVVAFLDTCFSGRVGAHDSLFPGIAPLVPTPVAVAPLQSAGKTTLFLAGQAYQFANDYPERGYRLFSYYLMRGMLDGNDDPAMLEDFVAREVRRVSSKRGAEFVQEPQLQGATLSMAAPAARNRRAH